MDRFPVRDSSHVRAWAPPLDLDLNLELALARCQVVTNIIILDLLLL